MTKLMLRRHLLIWLILTGFALFFCGLSGTLSAALQPEVATNCCDGPLPCPDAAPACDESQCPCSSFLHCFHPQGFILGSSATTAVLRLPAVANHPPSRYGDPIDYPPETV